jgi:nucleoid-associated protein YgaU
LVLVACGVALAGGMAPLTHASEGADSPGSDSSSGLVVGLPVPDRTAVVAPTAASPAAPFRVSARRVVVAPGDSLWSIAARRLPPEAPSDAVEALWREIYAANAAAIGPDPDLIRPGMRLQVPGVAR